MSGLKKPEYLIAAKNMLNNASINLVYAVQALMVSSEKELQILKRLYKKQLTGLSQKIR